MDIGLSSAPYALLTSSVIFLIGEFGHILGLCNRAPVFKYLEHTRPDSGILVDFFPPSTFYIPQFRIPTMSLTLKLVLWPEALSKAIFEVHW